MELAPEVELFVFEGIKGGRSIEDKQGDIAVDNIIVTAGDCSRKTILIKLIHAVLNLFINMKFCVFQR